MANALSHFEVMTNDPKKCKAFYGAVFDWTFDDDSMPGYSLINTGAEPSGGVMARPADAPAPALHVYFQVENISNTLRKATNAGGSVIVPSTDIPNVGTFAMIADPEGIVFGILKPQ